VHLVLASASPRRAELLRAAGYSFDIVAVDIDERARDGESPALYVRRLAAEKSAAGSAATGVASGVSRTETESMVILGADTAVVVDDEILGKPRDDDDAARMLRRLSGRQHHVLTGISLRRGAYEIGRVISTIVEFTPLTDGDISWYLASGEGRDKAGAYAIQGLASRFIPRVDGSYSNVVGLPVAAVHELLVDIASEARSGYSDSRIFPRKSL
jgi:septum formation protein